MCHISRSLQTLNEKSRFISSCQKGFMKIPAACAEHATIVDEMIHDAARNRKSLYILTIDFRDAFGSVPHKLIKKNLRDLGFDMNFVKSILASYDGSTTRIVSNNRTSRELFINKGVKQGCPLSPTLFNICLESLLRKLAQHEVDGYHWFGMSSVVQAYADDVILFSDTEEGMNNLICVVENFCKFAGHMVINANKCSSFTYIVSNGTRSVMNDNFHFNGEPVPNISIQGSTTYLGLPIAARASERKKHVFKRIQNMSRDVLRISKSALRFTQAVDAIKKFVLPKIDYELIANTAPVNALNRFDSLVRGSLSRMIGASGIPVEWFYTPRKSGGLDLQMLTDRQKALTVRLYVGLRESEDSNVRKVIKASDEAEITFRGARVDETSPYLRVATRDNGSLDSAYNRGTSNLLARCVKALHDLRCGLTRTDDTFNLTDLESDTDTSTTVNKSNLMKSLMKIIKQRNLMNLLKHNMKGHSFYTLQNSPISNFFLKPNTLMSDAVVKFAIKARTNSLVVGPVRAARSGNAEDKKCKLCGEIETLCHMINGCKHKKHCFTRRHNAVQDVLRNYLTEKVRVNVHSNQTVRGRGSERLTGQVSSLKPDLWWWNDNHLYIAEFTIPYGSLTDRGGESQSTLTVRRNEKLDKYLNLVNECSSQFNCETTLLVYIVSSLGAMPAETIEDLRKVTASNKDAGKLAGRMVAAALRESMFLYHGIKVNDADANSNDPGASDDSEHEFENQEVDITIDQSDTFDAPIDPEDDEDDTSMNTLDDNAWRDLIHDDTVASDDDVSQDSSAFPNSDVDEADSETDVLENSGTAPLWNTRPDSIGE